MSDHTNTPQIQLILSLMDATENPDPAVLGALLPRLESLNLLELSLLTTQLNPRATHAPPLRHAIKDRYLEQLRYICQLDPEVGAMTLRVLLERESKGQAIPVRAADIPVSVVFTPLAREQSFDAALDAAFLLKSLPETSERSRLLTDFQGMAGTLPHTPALTFLAVLHEHLCAEPDLIRASRRGLVQRFTQLTEQQRPPYLAALTEICRSDTLLRVALCNAERKNPPPENN